MNTNEEVPFKVQIAEESITLLKQKLALTTFPDDPGRDYGAQLPVIKRLVDRWRDVYDWRRHEAEINELPQFRRMVDVENFGQLQVHYVHKKSRVECAIPMLFVHGCKPTFICQFPHWHMHFFFIVGPGSFLEVRKILPLLTEPEDSSHPSFHVVALSLPGYGFSSAPTKSGFGIPQHAEVSCLKFSPYFFCEERNPALP